jgi:glutaredoxin
MKVEIYTKTYCPGSKRVKQPLRIKAVACIYRPSNGDPLHAEAMHRSGVQATFPEIIIADCLIGGRAGLFDLDESGVLDRLLATSSESPQ